MTKIFAASAYVAVMSLAITNDSASRTPHRVASGPSGAASALANSALAKTDCEESACSRTARRFGDRDDAAHFASLARTGPNETTATRSSAR